MNTHWEINEKNEISMLQTIKCNLEEYMNLKFQDLDNHANHYQSLSYDLTRNGKEALKQITKIVPKLKNVRNLFVEVSESETGKFEKTFNPILNQILDLNLEITYGTTPISELESIFSKIPQVQKLTLSNIVVVNQKSLKAYTGLSQLPNLKQLALKIQPEKSIKIPQFIENFKPPKSIESLSLDLQSANLTDAQVKSLFSMIASLNQLKELTLFWPTVEMTEKGFEQIPILLKKATFKLVELNIMFNREISEAGLKNFKTVLTAQKDLQRFDFGGLSTKPKSTEILFSLISCPPSIVNLSLDFSFYKNMRNQGLSLISSNIMKLSGLKALKIMFDGSNFSGEEVKLFGSALSSLKFLNDLRMEFPGKVKDDQIAELAESIASCSQLQYLYINFSGSGFKNHCEFSSRNSSETIFQTQKALIKQQQRYGHYVFCSGYYHFFVIQLAIAMKSENIRHLSICRPQLEKADPKVSNYVQKTYKEFISAKCKQISVLEFSKQDDSIDQELIELVKQNKNTLISIKATFNQFNQLKGSIKLEQLNTCRLFLKYDSNIVIEQFALSLPNLINLEISTVNQSLVVNNKQLQKIVDSNLISLEVHHLQEFKYNKANILMQNILREKKSFIYSQILYKRFIQDQLIFAPKMSHQDLWI